MHLGVITDEISQDFERALDVMLEYGVTGAELRGLWGTNIADLSREQVARAKGALQERGMTAIGIATPFYKCDLTEEASDEPAGPLHLAAPLGLEQQMELLRRCIQLAHEFETPLLRVFTFWRKEALTPELEERIIDAFDDPVNLAAQEGVTLTLENEHSCFIGTGAKTRVLLVERSRVVPVRWSSATCGVVRPKRKSYFSDCISNFDICTSSVPMVSAPFMESFMFPVPDASFPAVDICSERSAAGITRSASDTR